MEEIDRRSLMERFNAVNDLLRVAQLNLRDLGLLLQVIMEKEAKAEAEDEEEVGDENEGEKE